MVGLGLGLAVRGSGVRVRVRARVRASDASRDSWVGSLCRTGSQSWSLGCVALGAGSGLGCDWAWFPSTRRGQRKKGRGGGREGAKASSIRPRVCG